MGFTPLIGYALIARIRCDDRVRSLMWTHSHSRILSSATGFSLILGHSQSEGIIRTLGYAQHVGSFEHWGTVAYLGLTYQTRALSPCRFIPRIGYDSL